MNGIVKYIFICIVLLGCYSERKAKQQFSKAVVAYPKIPADYCANQFPVKDSLITDTLLTTDTLYLEQLSDTVIVQGFDTVRIYITKTLPAKVITNTIHIRDTIYKTNTAALETCEIDKSILTGLLKDKTIEADKYHNQANKRGWIMWGLILLIIGAIGMRIYMKSKKIKI